jgi:hypothetical protein
MFARHGSKTTMFLTSRSRCSIVELKVKLKV